MTAANTRIARYWTRMLDEAGVPNEVPVDTQGGELRKALRKGVFGELQRLDVLFDEGLLDGGTFLLRHGVGLQHLDAQAGFQPF